MSEGIFVVSSINLSKFVGQSLAIDWGHAYTPRRDWASSPQELLMMLNQPPRLIQIKGEIQQLKNLCKYAALLHFRGHAMASYHAVYQTNLLNALLTMVLPCD